MQNKKDYQYELAVKYFVCLLYLKSILMKNTVFILFAFSIFFLFSCNSNTVEKEEENKRVELFVREPLKSILDSLIAIDNDKDLIQEICLQRLVANDYRIAIISRSYSLDRDYGKPINFFMSNGKKIDIYTGVETFFQPSDSIPFKEETNARETSRYINYRIIEFHIDCWVNKIAGIKIIEAPEYIPFLEVSHDFL